MNQSFFTAFCSQKEGLAALKLPLSVTLDSCHMFDSFAGQVQFATMDYVSATNLEDLATQAVHDLAGNDAAVVVTAEDGEDWTGDPAVLFTFVVTKGRVFDWPPGLFRIKLIQRLSDRLAAVGDARYPIILSLLVSDRNEQASA